MSTCFQPVDAGLWQAYSCAERRVHDLLQAPSCQACGLPTQLNELALHARLLASCCASSGQPLLQEWLLRRWLFLLAEQAQSVTSDWQRQLLLDQLYRPLLELYALYKSFGNSASRQFALQAELHQLFRSDQQH